MPKRIRSEDAPVGLLAVRLTANATLDQFLDLKSISNLRASCNTLSNQYSPGAVHALWVRQEIKDPAAIMGSPGLTVKGATLLQGLYKFTAPTVRKACPNIFTRASESGDFELAKWYTATYGIAGLMKEGHNYKEIAIDGIGLARSACNQGHLDFVMWLFELLGIVLTDAHCWSSLIEDAIHSRNVAMADWIYQRCPPCAATKRVMRRANISVLRHRQWTSLQTIINNNDVKMMAWAKSAFSCSQEWLNEIVITCFMLTTGIDVARYILQQCGPLGRGPNAEKLRMIYAQGPSAATIVCPLPEEPEDSVYNPDDSFEMGDLPNLSPEERRALDESDARLH